MPKRPKIWSNGKPKYKKLEKVKSDANTVMQLNTLIDSSDFSEIDQKLYENMKRNSDGTFSCKVCSKTAKDKTHMKYHVETHMKGLSYPCITCGKDFRSRNALTLYLMGGGIECLPLAKIAPVHQGVTFLIIFFDDNSYLYIYY